MSSNLTRFAVQHLPDIGTQQGRGAPSLYVAFAALAICIGYTSASAQDAQTCNANGKRCVLTCNAENPGKDAAAKIALHDCRTRCESERAACNRDAQAAHRAEVEAKRKQHQMEVEANRKQRQIELEEARAKRQKEIDVRNAEASQRREEQKAEAEAIRNQRQAEAEATLRQQQMALEPRCEAFIQWSKRLEQEYPELDFRRQPVVRLQILSLNLFADEHFVPAFGKPYDAMSSGERESVHASTINPCQVSTKYRGGFWQWTTLGQPFNKLPNNPFGSATVSKEVAQRREARAALARLRQEAETLPASVQGYERLAAIGNEANVLLTPPSPGDRNTIRTNVPLTGPLFPSEETAIRAGIASHRTRLADGALNDRLGPLLSAAPVYDTAQSLRRVTKDHAVLLGEVSPEARQRYEQSIQERLGAVLAHLLQDEKTKIAQFANNASGLEQGASWYYEFEKRYVAEFKDESVQAIRKFYLDRRRAQIAAAAPELVAMVRKSSAATQADEILARYLALPSDNEDADARAVFAAADRLKVRFCDEGGAHQDDPEAVAAGIADDKIEAASLIATCEAAVKIDPKTPRFRFQLARGLLLGGLYAPAVEQLVAAAGEGHGASLAYLGDLHLDGGAGIDADPMLAHALFERAIASGFAPARAILNEFEDRSDEFALAQKEEAQWLAENPGAAPPSWEKFFRPEIIQGILDQDFDSIEYGELYTKTYLLHVAENIAGVCEAHFTPREVQEMRTAAAMRLATAYTSDPVTGGLATLLEVLKMAANPMELFERSIQADIARENVPDEGMKDAFKLMEIHPCNSAELESFSQNLRAFISDQVVPMAAAGDLMTQCLREAQPTGRYRGQDFCMCFVGAVRTNPMSRAQRLALSERFWPTAQELLMSGNSSFSACHSGVGR
jgi:hypothetical protein